MAIALKYDREKDDAPRVVAKGLRLRAEKIKELAKQYNVPVELYDAVAEVLNFVFALQQEQLKK